MKKVGAACAVALGLVLWLWLRPGSDAISQASINEKKLARQSAPAPVDAIEEPRADEGTTPPHRLEAPAQGPERLQYLRTVLGSTTATLELRNDAIAALSAVANPSNDQMNRLAKARRDREAILQRIAEQQSEIAAFDVNARAAPQNPLETPLIRVSTVLSRHTQSDWNRLAAEHIGGTTQINAAAFDRIQKTMRATEAHLASVQIPQALRPQMEALFMQVVSAILENESPQAVDVEVEKFVKRAQSLAAGPPR